MNSHQRRVARRAAERQRRALLELGRLAEAANRAAEATRPLRAALSQLAARIRGGRRIVAVDPGAPGSDRSMIVVARREGRLLHVEQIRDVGLVSAAAIDQAFANVRRAIDGAAREEMQRISEELRQGALERGRRLHEFVSAGIISERNAREMLGGPPEPFPSIPVQRQRDRFYVYDREAFDAARRGIYTPAEFAARGAGSRESTRARRAREAAEEAKRLETRRALPEGAREAGDVAARIQSALVDNEAAFLEHYSDCTLEVETEADRRPARGGSLVDVRAESVDRPFGVMHHTAPTSVPDPPVPVLREARVPAPVGIGHHHAVEPPLPSGRFAGHRVIARFILPAEMARRVEYLTPDETEIVRVDYPDSELVELDPAAARALGVLPIRFHQHVPAPRHVNCRSVPIAYDPAHDANARGTMSRDDNDDDDPPFRPEPLAPPVQWGRRR